MKNTLVLALDLGTSSVRAMLFDIRGKDIPGMEAQIPYTQRTSSDGGVDVDAEELLALTVRCVSLLLRKTDHANQPRIAAVGISCFWHSLVGVGGDSRAVTPVYSWADTRSRAFADRLRTTIDPKAYHARTGCPLHPSFWPAKLLWLAETQPDLTRRVERWMSFGEYVALRLFGTANCSISMASGTGISNPNLCDWDDEILKTLHVTRERLNPLVDRDAPQSGIVPEFEKVLAPLKSIPWFPAIGDGACSNLGSGAVTERQIAINVGTSGAMRIVVATEKSNPIPGLYCYRVDRSRFVIGGGFTSGGNVHAWLLNTLKLDKPDAVSRAIDKMPPDGHGLTVLPFWAGERAPGWHTDARAAITGMNLHTTGLDITRASLEAVALSYDTTREVLQKCYPHAEEIIASGGAVVHDPVWVRIMADVFGIPVTLSRVGEASSRGAALLALQSLGIVPDLAGAPKYLGHRYLPDAARHKVYQRARKRYDSLYGMLLDGKTAPPD